jgi:hypothetical protein
LRKLLAASGANSNVARRAIAASIGNADANYLTAAQLQRAFKAATTRQSPSERGTAIEIIQAVAKDPDAVALLQFTLYAASCAAKGAPKAMGTAMVGVLPVGESQQGGGEAKFRFVDGGAMIMAGGSAAAELIVGVHTASRGPAMQSWLQNHGETLLDAATCIQFLTKAARSSQTEPYVTPRDTMTLRGVAFTSTYHLSMTLRFPTIVAVDATCKTNTSDWPLHTTMG